MQDLILQYPVYTLEARELFPVGTVLSPATLAARYLSEKAAPVQTLSLLEYGSIREDILKFLGMPPYNFIFNTGELVAELMGTMETISLISPFLEALDYFRKHDFYTYRHILMVFALSILLAKEVLHDYRDRIHEIATSPTHDYGKICVPIPILKKSTPLTKTEYSTLKHHSAAGYALLSYYYKNAGNIFAKVALEHHERRNGSGYPRGIVLNDPLVEIIAACDVYDALISPRPYRPVSYNNRTALEEITKMAERSELGWEVVQALIALNRRTKSHFREIRVSEEKRGTPPEENFYGMIAEENSNH